MKNTHKLITLFAIILVIILIMIDALDIVLRVTLIIGIILLTTAILLYQKAEVDSHKPKPYKNYGNIDTKVCPICKTVNNDKRVYCRKCNTPIRNIKCPVCESLNPFDQKYCNNCDSILRNKGRY